MPSHFDLMYFARACVCFGVSLSIWQPPNSETLRIDRTFPVLASKSRRKAISELNKWVSLTDPTGKLMSEQANVLWCNRQSGDIFS
jgi:hypothetical protein